MSRMTLLQGEIWFGGAGPDRALPNLVRAPEAGYPPYNIEVLAEGDGTRNVLRTTLAVAGFSVDELAVTVEDDQLVVRGKQLEERAPDYLYRASRRDVSSGASGSPTGVEVRNAELHDGLLAIEPERPVKEATVKTVRDCQWRDGQQDARGVQAKACHSFGCGVDTNERRRKIRS